MSCKFEILFSWIILDNKAYKYIFTESLPFKICLYDNQHAENKSGLHSVVRISHFLNNKFLETWAFMWCFTFFPGVCYRHPLSCPSLYCTLQLLCFIQSENLHRHCVSSKSISAIFPTVCSLHISMSHFGISCNTSNFFIIIVFVMVICDQWSLMLLL